LRSWIMTNFKDKRRAVAIIREVFEKTSEEYLQLRIDEPVGKAATSFEFDRDAPVTHKIFTRAIADFVRHVHEQGCGENKSSQLCRPGMKLWRYSKRAIRVQLTSVMKPRFSTH